MQSATNQKSIAKIVKNLPVFQSNFTNWHEEINAMTQYVECVIVDEPKVNNLRKDYGCEKNFGENKTYSCKNLKRPEVNILDDHHMIVKTRSQFITADKGNDLTRSGVKPTNRDEFIMYNEITGEEPKPIIVHDLARSESVDELGPRFNKSMPVVGDRTCLSCDKPEDKSKGNLIDKSLGNSMNKPLNKSADLPIDNTSVTIIAGRYLIGDLISGGSYSNVFKCIDMYTRKKCVIKEFLDNECNFRPETMRELTVLSTLRNSPHIVGVHSIISAIDTGDLSTRFYAVLNYHTKTLHDFIYEHADSPSIRRDLGEIFYRDIARGLAYMHACGIAHCDLKPANILITSTHNAVIADFSLALFIGHQHTNYGTNLSNNSKFKCNDCDTRQMGSQVQTLGYRAPEILFEKENFDGFAADVWSFGCVAAEIYYGYPLFYLYGGHLDYLKSVIRELGPIDPSLDYMQMGEVGVVGSNNRTQNTNETRYQPITSPCRSASLDELGGAIYKPTPKSTPVRNISNNKYELITETRDYYENYMEAMNALGYGVSKETIGEDASRGINNTDSKSTKVKRPRVPKIADSDLRNVIEECLLYDPKSRPMMMVIASYFESCYGGTYIAGKHHPMDSIDFNTEVPKSISKRMGASGETAQIPPYSLSFSRIHTQSQANRLHQENWQCFLKTSSRERHLDWLINTCAGFMRKECIYETMRIYDMFFKEITKFVDLGMHPIVLPSIGSFSRTQLYEYARLGAYAIGCILYEDLEIDVEKLAGDCLDKFILAKFIIFMATTLKFDFGICERIFMDMRDDTAAYVKVAQIKQNLLNGAGLSPRDSAKLYY